MSKVELPNLEAMEAFGKRIADKLEPGDVVTIGGIWKYADFSKVHADVTVVDLSKEMLASYADLL